MNGAVLIWCDLGPDLGIGHAMRCLALAEELALHGLQPIFFADAGSVPFAQQQIEARGFAHITPTGDLDEQVASVVAIDPRAIVIDSYLLPPEGYADLQTRFPTLAIVDGDPQGRRADVYVDQNIGAENDVWPLPRAAVRLAGLSYALMRDEVLRHRPVVERPSRVGIPRIFAFFGGTDPFAAAPLVTETLIHTNEVFDLTVVAARPELRRLIRDLSPRPGQHVNAIDPTDRLPALVTSADLVISASGSSSWELLCLGAAVAFLCVADNQRDSHVRLTRAGYGFDIGDLDGLRAAPGRTLDTLRTALGDGAERARLQRQALQVVDGQGRRRVTDVLLRVLAG